MIITGFVLLIASTVATAAYAGSSSIADSSSISTGNVLNYGSNEAGAYPEIYSPRYPHTSSLSSSNIPRPYPQLNPPFYSQPLPPYVPFHYIVPPFPQIPYVPLHPIVHPAEFNQALNRYVNSLQQHYASGGSFTYSSPDATAYAYSSLGPANLYQHQAAIWDEWQKGGGANNVPYYAPGFAAASASYGPTGIHQTASLYPPNPNTPNVETRFGIESGGNNPAGGYYGVSTSSFSSSSDQNGVKTNRKGAFTTVNDNGKITTYKLES